MDKYYILSTRKYGCQPINCFEEMECLPLEVLEDGMSCDALFLFNHAKSEAIEALVWAV